MVKIQQNKTKQKNLLIFTGVKCGANKMTLHFIKIDKKKWTNLHAHCARFNKWSIQRNGYNSRFKVKFVGEKNACMSKNIHSECIQGVFIWTISLIASVSGSISLHLNRILNEIVFCWNYEHEIHLVVHIERCK